VHLHPDRDDNPVLRAVEATLARDQPDISDDIDHDTVADGVIDAFRTLSAHLGSYEHARSHTTAYDRHYRTTQAYDDERDTATVVKPIVAMASNMVALAVFARREGSAAFTPQPGLLSIARAKTLRKRYRENAAIDAAMTLWKHGEDTDLFAPFGDISPDQKDVIVDFLDQCTTDIRPQVVAGWIGMARKDRIDEATAMTQGHHGAHGLWELALARVQASR